jgi:hypothetical protein
MVLNVLRKEYTVMAKTLKNQYSSKYQQDGDNYESTLTEADKIKRRLDANAVVSRPFPFKPEQYKYPEPAINIGNPLYMTANMEYGRLKPTEYEI